MEQSIEELYQKKSQHEHIILRPDMYIGTIEPVTDDVWIFCEEEQKMKLQKITWIPGLYKIFDEILVNAADNKIRDPVGQTVVKVEINSEKGFVSVMNNGEGVPVEKHKIHELWVPEMIFGHLLTSSNYDDTQVKVTGGRNGYGAKLTNVFSTCFEIETAHSKSKKRFKMRWRNNMLETEEPVITPFNGSDFTTVTFFPDFKKFNVKGFSDDMLLLMKRRVYDLAGCTSKSLKCFLNGVRLPISTFSEYVDLYPMVEEEKKSGSYARVNDRWEVCVRVSNIGFQQASFVNSICTTRGGTHVRYITDQIIQKVTEFVKKKNRIEAKAHMIKPHLFLFINCLIENPAFDSQTKETLNTLRQKFGSTCDLPSSMIDYILKSDVIRRTIESANSKLTREMASKLRNTDRRAILGIPKLDDANEAGGKFSSRCTLILTEGDSAKSLCTAGLAVVGRDYYGVFPLRGKLLNVRDASLKKISSCEEIQAVMKIIGLDIRQKYTSTDSLRYGHLMIMSDQDFDGSHIKGLVINFIHHFWPDLVKTKGFLQQFITPIVKARRKGKDTNVVPISFYSMPEYLEWKQTQGPLITSRYDIRYYKGLGTSGAEEGREYFQKIDKHRLTFYYSGDCDDNNIIKAFSKDHVEERKKWITDYSTNVNHTEGVNYNQSEVSFTEFVDQELILFSVADCERSIPSVLDGLKPGQRKILFSAFKRRLTKSIRVMQLAGYTSEHAAYHHGDMSLVQTIVALAQNFVGANNLPLFHPDGQFGTRLVGGKDHAAGRYIFTRLSHIASLIYHQADEFVVSYKDDDGLSVEPFFYVPVIPMVIVNGTSGIGTGFATNIPNYNPLEVIRNVRCLLRGEPMTKLYPWYLGFGGSIIERENGKFISQGKYVINPNGVIHITELPIGMWTNQYKKFIEDLIQKELIIQYRENNTDVTVDFDIFLHPEVFKLWTDLDILEERLQLREYIHATNLIAFNSEGKLTKYHDACSMITEFFPIRYEYYQKRKDFLLGELRRHCDKLENMRRFVIEVVNGTLVISKKSKKKILNELEQKGYTPFPPKSKKKTTATTIESEESTEGDDHTYEGDNVNQDSSRFLASYNLNASSGSQLESHRTEDESLIQATRDYDYLLGMRLWNLTEEMIQRLEQQLYHAQNELKQLEGKTINQLWLDDLDVLEPAIVDTFKKHLDGIEEIKKRNQKRYRPFDVSRIRIPMLSNEAKSALAKEIPKNFQSKQLTSSTDTFPSVSNSKLSTNALKRSRNRSSSEEGVLSDTSEEDTTLQINQKSSKERKKRQPIKSRKVLAQDSEGALSSSTLDNQYLLKTNIEPRNDLFSLDDFGLKGIDFTSKLLFKETKDDKIPESNIESEVVDEDLQILLG